MAREITLKFPAICEQCSTQLEKGQPARYYGIGRVYGVNCHPQVESRISRSRKKKSKISENQSISDWSNAAIQPVFILEIGSDSDSAIRFDAPQSGKVIVRFNPVNSHAAMMLEKGRAIAHLYIESLYVDAAVAIMINKRSAEFKVEQFFTLRDYVLRTMNRLEIESETTNLIDQFEQYKR